MCALRTHSRPAWSGAHAAGRWSVCVAAALLLLAGVGGSGCSRVGGKKRNPSGLFVVTQGGRAGYIDRDGKLVISPQFDKAYGFTEGLAAVVLGGRTGFIDEHGKYAVNPQYDDAFSFYEGLAAVKVNGRMGYIWNPSR